LAKMVILERDGVISHRQEEDITTVEGWDPIAGSIEAIKRLSARGASVDGIFYCPHGPEANCICRKPKPGLLYQISRKFGIDLSETPLVGDNISDIRAAEIANAKAVLVRTGRGEYTMQHFPEALDVPVFDDLAHFVRNTLRRR